MLRSRRFALAAAALVLGISACGGANNTSTAAKAPTVIHVGSGGGGNSKATAGAAVDESMRPYFGNITYVYDGQFPDLGTLGGAWSLPTGAKPDLNRVAAIANALGVKGEVRSLPTEQGGGWAVGPNDGSAPSILVGNDAQLSWWYNGTVATTGYSCAGSATTVGGDAVGAGGVGGAVGGGVAVPPPDASVGGSKPDVAPPDNVVSTTVPMPCEPPPPPANVPDKAAALAKAKAILSAAGVDLAAYDVTTYADSYGASVTGQLMLGTHRSPLSVNVGFGADAAITYASGFLAVPQAAADYPLVSAEVGVQRLNDPTGRFIFSGGPFAIRDAVGVNVATSSIGGSAPAGGASEPAPVLKPAAVPIEPPTPAPMPCGASTGCTTPAPPAPPPPVTIHLNAVRVDLTMVWAQDGTIWLLPAYTFTAIDASEYTVVAVDESYLDLPKPVTLDTGQGAPTPVVTVIPPTPDPVVPVEPTTMPPVDPAVAAKVLVGLTLAQATDTAKANGWTVRVSTLDGQSQILTADFSQTRVNLSVTGGMVVGVDNIG